jgi:hypothetical protein
MVNPGFRPVMMRPPGAAFSAGPPTVISSPGLARMPVAIAAGGMRPVFIGKELSSKKSNTKRETACHVIEKFGIAIGREPVRRRKNVKKKMIRKLDVV